MEKRIAELLRLLENHDCHMSGEDGCICEGIMQELVSLNYLVPDYRAVEIEPF